MVFVERHCSTTQGEKLSINTASTTNIIEEKRKEMKPESMCVAALREERQLLHECCT